MGVSQLPFGSTPARQGQTNCGLRVYEAAIFSPRSIFLNYRLQQNGALGASISGVTRPPLGRLLRIVVTCPFARGQLARSCAPLSQESLAILTGDAVGFSGGAYRKRIADQRARFRASLVHLRPFGLAACDRRRNARGL